MATNFYGLKDQPIILLSEIYANAASLTYAYEFDGVQIGDYVLVKYEYVDEEKYDDLLENNLSVNAINIFTETKNQTISNLEIDNNINNNNTVWKKGASSYEKVLSFEGECQYFIYKGVYENIGGLPSILEIDENKGNYAYLNTDNSNFDLYFYADNNATDSWEWRKNNFNTLILNDEESGLKITYSSKYIVSLLPELISSSMHELDVNYFADSLNHNKNYQDNYLQINLDFTYDPELTYYYLTDNIYYEYQYSENTWTVDLTSGLYIKYKDIHLVGNHFNYLYSHNHGWISNSGKFLDVLPLEEGSNNEYEKDLLYFETSDNEYNSSKIYYYLNKFKEYIALTPIMTNVLSLASYSSTTKYYFELNSRLKDILDFYDKTCIDLLGYNSYVNYTNNTDINSILLELQGNIQTKINLVNTGLDVSVINQSIFSNLLEIYLTLFLDLKDDYEKDNNYNLDVLNYNLVLELRKNLINIQNSYSLDELIYQIKLFKNNIVSLNSIFYKLYEYNNWEADKIYLKEFNWNNYTLYEKDNNKQFLVCTDEDSLIKYIDFQKIDGIRQKIICEDCSSSQTSTSINLYSTTNHYNYSDGTLIFVKFINGLSATTTVTLNLTITDDEKNETVLSGNIKYNGKDGSSVEYDDLFIPAGREALFLVDVNELNDVVTFYLLNPYYKLSHTHYAANIDKIEYGTWTPYFNKILESNLNYTDALNNLISKGAIVETSNWQIGGSYYNINPSKVTKLIVALGSTKKLSNSINYKNISNDFSASIYSNLTITSDTFVTYASYAIKFLENNNIIQASDNWFNYFSNLGYPKYQSFFWLCIKTALRISSTVIDNIIERKNCNYTRIGNIVNLQFDIELKTSVLNNLEIELKGLPYNPMVPAGSTGFVENVKLRSDTIKGYYQSLYLDPKVSTWQEAIQILSNKKLITSPSYWNSILNNSSELISNLKTLIVLLGNFEYNDTKQRNISTVKNAIIFLDRKNAMLNTSYWYDSGNYSQIQYLDQLLLLCANRLESSGALLGSFLEIRTCIINSDGTTNLNSSKYLNGASQNTRIYGNINYLTNQTDFIKNKTEEIEGISVDLMQAPKTETQIDNSSIDYVNLLEKKAELEQAYQKLANRLAVLNSELTYEIEE